MRRIPVKFPCLILVTAVSCLDFSLENCSWLAGDAADVKVNLGGGCGGTLIKVLWTDRIGQQIPGCFYEGLWENTYISWRDRERFY